MCRHEGDLPALIEATRSLSRVLTPKRDEVAEAHDGPDDLVVVMILDRR